MVTKKLSRPKSAAQQSRDATLEQLTSLQTRVEHLERDSSEMRSDMFKLTEELGALRVVVKHVDERTLRGEKLMGLMQIEQRRQTRTINRIADALDVEHEPEPELSDPAATPPQRGRKVTMSRRP